MADIMPDGTAVWNITRTADHSISIGSAALAALLLAGCGSYTAHQTAYGAGSRSGSRSSPFISGSRRLPVQLTGTWTGSVFQASASESYPVTIKLARMPGTKVGTSSYPTLKCKGVLRLDRVSSRSIVVTEHIISGAYKKGHGGDCITPARITLKYLTKNNLIYTFPFDGDPNGGGDPDDGQATLVRYPSP